MQDELPLWSDDEDGALESVSEGISGPEMDSDDDEPGHDVSDILSDDASIEIDEFGRMGPTSAPSATYPSRIGALQGAQRGAVDIAGHSSESTPDATPDTTLDDMSLADSEDDGTDRGKNITARPSLATIPRKPSYSSDVPTVKAHMRGASTSAVVQPRPPVSHTRGSSASATVMAHRRTASAIPSSSRSQPSGSSQSHSRASSSSGSGSGSGSGCGSGPASRRPSMHTRTSSRSSGAASPFGPSPLVTARRPPPISVPGKDVILPPPRSASLSARTSAILADSLDAVPATAIPRILSRDDADDANGTEELVTVRPSLEFDGNGTETETLETVDTPDEESSDGHGSRPRSTEQAPETTFGAKREGEGEGKSELPRSHTQETVMPMPRSATQETVTPGLSSAPSQRFFPDFDDDVGSEGEDEMEEVSVERAEIKEAKLAPAREV